MRDRTNWAETLRYFWLAHRKGLEGIWVVGVIAYSGFLTFVVSKTVSKYGVSTRWFAEVALIAAIPDAVGTAKMVAALAEHRNDAARRWALVAASGYFAPEAFVVATREHLPTRVYVVLALWASLGMIVAIVSLR